MLDPGVPPSPILLLVPCSHSHLRELQIDWDWPPSSLKNAQLELCVCVKLNFYNSTTADDFYFKNKVQKACNKIWLDLGSYLGGFFEGVLLLFFMEKIPSKKGVATLGVPSFFLAQRSNRVAAVSSSLKWDFSSFKVQKLAGTPLHKILGRP